MALTTLVTKRLVPLLRDGARVASMGYPDLVAPDAVLQELLEYHGNGAFIKVRPDSARICKHHGLEPRDILDSHSFFEAFGAELDVFDIAAIRGNEIIRDLNYPIDERDEYDFVLDVGTIEHCFNIGQAAINMAGLLKEGGRIFHGNPHNAGNHGFYGLNPTWYADFYGQDGFELDWCLLQPAGSDDEIEVRLTGRFGCMHPNINIFAAARRTEVRSIGFPTQTKYAHLIGGKNG